MRHDTVLAFALPLFFEDFDDDDGAIVVEGAGGVMVTLFTVKRKLASISSPTMPISNKTCSHLGFTVNALVKMSAAILSVTLSVRFTSSESMT